MMKKIVTLLLTLACMTGLSAHTSAYGVARHGISTTTPDSLTAHTNNNKTFRDTHGDVNAPGARKNITFDTNNITFWVGHGSNSATFIVGWDDETTPTALVWGVRWNGTATALSLLDSICAHDPRMSYSYANSFMSYIYYDDTAHNEHHHGLGSSYWCYYLNGDWAPNGYGNQSAANHDIFEVSSSCNFTMTTATAATNPHGGSAAVTDATIDSAAILYWVGTGDHHIIMSVNWHNPDTCLAWGYRFNSDSITLQEAMNAIDSADWRFHYTGSPYVADILFLAGNDTLKLSAASGYNYWWNNINGLSGMGLSSVMHSGDFAKWGDAAMGTVTDTVNGYPSQIAFTTIVTPVSIPGTNPYVGPFCGAVGTAGCEAIPADSNIIVAWATGCTVSRGWQDIATPGVRVTYGTDSLATGPVSKNDNLSVVSLGDGGTATLSFARPIVNGNGYDFCVFENSFDDHFLELAFVEVSSDGETFVRFPATSLTQTTTQIGPNGSVDPTFINNLAGKYRMGYGTPFDLEELADSTAVNINHITHIRVVDVIGTLDTLYATHDAYGHIVNDPYPTNSYSGGFDLAGIGVMHQNTVGITLANSAVSISPNPAVSYVRISTNDNDNGKMIRLYDTMGRLVMSRLMQGNSTTLNLQNLQKGIYILTLNGTTTKLVIK